MNKWRVTAELMLAFAVTLWANLPIYAQRPNSRHPVSRSVAAAQYEQFDAVGSGSSGHTNSVGTSHELEQSFAMEAGPNNCDGALCDASCCSPLQHLLDWSRCDLLIGTTAFSNPTNFLTTGTNAAGQIEGSFGFQEGFNFGGCVPGLLCGQLGGQLGLRAIQSQLNGNVAGNDARNQLFATGGVFRRVDYGVQGGLVVDYLHDDWLTVVDLSQLRGELSFALSPCHTAGMRFTSALNTHQSSTRLATQTTPVAISLTALDSYRFFYRCGLGDEGRATAELNAGFTEDRDALLGAMLSAPLHGAVGIAATTTYLIPHSGAQPAYATESWNIGVALVWTPCRPFGTGRDYYRPLFEVADNGSLLTKRP